MNKPTLITDPCILTAFGEHLRASREQQTISLEAMAERCDVPVGDIGAIEAGARDLHATLIAQLVEAYDLNAEKLLAALAAAPSGHVDTDELKQSFLGIDSPNRGKMFQDFISQLPKQAD